jgi:hypothetical protein
LRLKVALLDLLAKLLEAAEVAALVQFEHVGDFLKVRMVQSVGKNFKIGRSLLPVADLIKRRLD